MSTRIEKIQNAVEKACNSTVTHVGSVPVHDSYQGETVWEGVVEVFGIETHPKAKTCYGWSYQEGDDTKFATVLGVGPVVSPQTAVKMFVVASGRKWSA